MCVFWILNFKNICIFLGILFCCLLINSCRIKLSENPAQITHSDSPGPLPLLKDNILETGTRLTQDFKSIKVIYSHLNAIHVYPSDSSRSVEANDYSTYLSTEVY